MSAAYHLARSGVSVALIEKESGPAMHQSGRNSGVIHAGYNLKPGSAKAQYCVEGNAQLRAYCNERDVAVKEGGILIVARTEAEISVIEELERRGTANGTSVRLLTPDQIKDIEPAAKGISALQAVDGASFDSSAYVQSLANDATRAGAKLLYNHKAQSVTESNRGVVIATSKGKFAAKTAINAAGLYADIVGRDVARDLRVVPFRGYYAELKPNKNELVRSHIYAAPDLNFPFLGIHLSRRTDGRVIAGPGAMLAFGREAYNFSSLKGGGFGKNLAWPGFYKMMAQSEFRNLFRTEIRKSLAVSAIGKEAAELVTGLNPTDLVRSYAGNRAQLVDKDGKLVDDIVVRETARTLHVLNAVSPGLTCSLPFGKNLAETATAKISS